MRATLDPKDSESDKHSALTRKQLISVDDTLVTSYVRTRGNFLWTKFISRAHFGGVREVSISLDIAVYVARYAGTDELSIENETITNLLVIR